MADRTRWRMPAEWQPHERCWMAWPANRALWPDGIERAERAYAAVANAIAQFEPVTMVVHPQARRRARQLLGHPVELLDFPLDDSWMRDAGPTFVRAGDGRLAGIDWAFNGWGGRFPHGNDRHLAGFILEQLGLPRLAPDMVLEGGSIHVDGAGTLLTTRECLLNPNRNPGLDQAAIEVRLRDYLGVDRLLWLERGLVDDHTDGHIDNLACFVAPGRVVALASHDPHDANHPALQANLELLRASTDTTGRRLEVSELEQPPAMSADGLRLACSYVNFYLANDAVIMPGFATRQDIPARETLQALFPQRTVVVVDGRDIVVGGGNIHCITQQQPANETRVND